MWTALLMSAALSSVPQQGGDLSLDNVRATMGILGPTRKDSDSPKLVQGDVFFLSFDINNLKVNDEGEVQYSVGMEWTNKDGKVFYRQEPRPLKIINTLGGGRVPGFVGAETFPDTPVGEYNLTAIVNDLAAKKEVKLTRKFEVVKTEFSLVRLSLSLDEDNKLHAPPVCVPGQRLVVHFLAAGFDRDKNKKPNITFKMRVLDSAGKPVLSKESAGEIKEAPENYKMIPARFFIYANRSGEFTVELEASDELARKKFTQSFKLTVNEVK